MGIRKDSAVDGAQYNNFIRDFVSYYVKYYNAIKNIVEKDIYPTVMKQEVWTDDFATQYALWFYDEKLSSNDGSDLLDKALLNMNVLFRTTCMEPNGSVVRNLGAKNIDSYGMIKKVKRNRGEMFNVLGVKKYRKANFKKVPLKRGAGWRSVAKAERINAMINNIDKDIKTAIDYAEKIESLVKTKMISPATRCISITGFTGANLKKSVDEIKQKLENFKRISTQKAQKAVQEVNTNQTEIHQSLENLSQEG